MGEIAAFVHDMVVPPIAVLLVSCLYFTSSLAALYTEPHQLPRHIYDYVIVGGKSSQWLFEGTCLVQPVFQLEMPEM